MDIFTFKLNLLIKKMENCKICNDHFIAKLVGRGIWHEWHSVGFVSECRDHIISLYTVILLYNKRIRCKHCSDHSNDYIIETGDKVMEILNNYELTDSEVIEYFNYWLYDYHCRANINSGKDPKTFPSYDEVANYYLNYEVCDKDCDK